jgi:hypothetical protein
MSFDPCAARQKVLDARRVLPLHPHRESLEPWLDLIDAALDHIGEPARPVAAPVLHVLAIAEMVSAATQT